MGSELLTHIWDLKLKLDLPAYCTWRCCSRLYWEPNPFQWMLLEITSDCLQHHERRKSGLNFKNIFLDPYTTNSLYFKQSLVDSRTWNWYMLYGHYIGLDGLIVYWFRWFNSIGIWVLPPSIYHYINSCNIINISNCQTFQISELVWLANKINKYENKTEKLHHFRHSFQPFQQYFTLPHIVQQTPADSSMSQNVTNQTPLCCTLK